MGPRRLLEEMLAIEVRAGRDRGAETLRWGPRALDLDLLFFGDDEIDEPDLVVPHPRLSERSFVLVPLADLAPDLVHPRQDATVAELLCRLSTDASVKSRPVGVRLWEQCRRIVR
jgi:2-amino-4-hydroxy-6-hydroxymethyldihydropteridine diphosphokinase